MSNRICQWIEASELDAVALFHSETGLDKTGNSSTALSATLQYVTLPPVDDYIGFT
jgi:hypothetical protein